MSAEYSSLTRPTLEDQFWVVMKDPDNNLLGWIECPIDVWSEKGNAKTFGFPEAAEPYTMGYLEVVNSRGEVVWRYPYYARVGKGVKVQFMPGGFQLWMR